MQRTLLVLALATLPAVAHARPSQPLTQFDGDRYAARLAQPAGGANDVTRALAARKKRAHPRTPRGRHRPIPVPRPKPGFVEPRVTASLGEGFAREVRSAVIGGRPSGCPHRFCGCALSIHIFGRIIPKLNLAANWRHAFPRAAPGPGMVAARSGHVFKLLAHVGGSTWRVWDANSGRGRIRIHNRSIAGFTIVNPGGTS